jgi:hypothetical protein
MRVPLADGWYLCNRRDRPDYEYKEFRGGRTLAVQWSRQFLANHFALCALRRLLIGTSPARGDEQILQELAWRLASGAWLARQRVIRKVGAPSEKRSDTPAPFPRAVRRAAPPVSPGSEPEPALFPTDTDAMAIAAAQMEAAALGLPFCEECLKAEMART